MMISSETVLVGLHKLVDAIKETPGLLAERKAIVQQFQWVQVMVCMELLQQVHREVNCQITAELLVVDQVQTQENAVV